MTLKATLYDPHTCGAAHPSPGELRGERAVDPSGCPFLSPVAQLSQPNLGPSDTFNILVLLEKAVATATISDTSPGAEHRDYLIQASCFINYFPFTVPSPAPVSPHICPCIAEALDLLHSAKPSLAATSPHKAWIPTAAVSRALAMLFCACWQCPVPSLPHTPFYWGGVSQNSI